MIETKRKCKLCGEFMVCELETAAESESYDLRLIMYCNNDDCDNIDCEFDKTLDYSDFTEL